MIPEGTRGRARGGAVTCWNVYVIFEQKLVCILPPLQTSKGSIWLAGELCCTPETPFCSTTWGTSCSKKCKWSHKIQHFVSELDCWEDRSLTFGDSCITNKGHASWLLHRGVFIGNSTQYGINSETLRYALAQGISWQRRQAPLQQNMDKYG